MTGNQAIVIFKTDYNNSGQGFRLEWKAINVSRCSNELDLVYAPSPGELHSLNYPQTYLNNLHCRTQIKTDNASRVWVRFTDFDLSVEGTNCSDLVTLNLNASAAPAAAHKLSSQRLCSWNNSDVRNLRFLSDSSTMEFVFTTDDLHNARGYSLSYHAGEAFLHKSLQYCHVTLTIKTRLSH